MSDPYRDVTHRRRRWGLVVPLALVVLIGLGWSGLWFFAASRAQTEFAAWRAREAARGRIVDCGAQEVGGFPFRIELRCGEPALGLQKMRLSLKAQSLHAAVQIYQPNLLIGEFAGPLTIAQDGQPAYAVDWKLAQASVHGLSATPDRVSLVVDQPTIARLADHATVAGAAHAEIHVREAPRLPQDPPAIDLVLHLVQAVVPAVPRVPNTPIDAQISVTLRGLDDFSPRPLSVVLRDLQAANGRLDVTQARIQQGDILTVGRGTLGLTARGTLDGELQLTIAGIEQLMTALGIDKTVGQASQRALDRLAPGLNLDALLGPRGNAALAAAGASMLGQPAQIEGRQAVTLPLRFADGAVFLGPLRVGEMAPLF